MIIYSGYIESKTAMVAKLKSQKDQEKKIASLWNAPPNAYVWYKYSKGY